MLNILKLTASLSARRKDPLPLRATNSILSFRSRVFSGKSQRWRYHSTKLGEYDERTNAGWGASLLDITMINEWREAGGRQRRSEEAAKKYRNTATVTAMCFKESNHFKITSIMWSMCEVDIMVMVTQSIRTYFAQVLSYAMEEVFSPFPVPSIEPFNAK